MRGVVVAKITGLLLCVALPASARDVARSTHASGQWRIDVRIGRFTSVRSCSIATRSKRARLSPVALAIRPLGNANVGLAWVKVDGGVARPWRDDLPELARSGVEIDGRDMAAPTDGWIWLAIEPVDKVSIVEVRIAPGKRVRRFDVSGTATALAAARSYGCRDSDFIR